MCLQEKGARVPTDDFNCESQQGRACGRESHGNEFAPGLVRHCAPIVKRQETGASSHRRRIAIIVVIVQFCPHRLIFFF